MLVKKYINYIIVFLLLAFPISAFAQSYDDYNAKVTYGVDSGIRSLKSFSTEMNFIQKKDFIICNNCKCKVLKK